MRDDRSRASSAGPPPRGARRKDDAALRTVALAAEAAAHAPGRSDALAAPASRLEALVRREFFARASGAAQRYGVAPDALVEHCLRHRPTSALATARMIANLEDLTHAVACLQGDGLAWSDLIEAVEPGLSRALRDRLDEATSLMLVRRWLAALRAGSVLAAVSARSERMAGVAGVAPNGARPGPIGSEATLSLAAYSGVRPLRLWLAERFLGELARGPAPGPGRRLRLTGRDFGPSMGPSEGVRTGLPSEFQSGS